MVGLLNFGQTWKIIANSGVYDSLRDTSSFLKIELNRVAKETGLIGNVRGQGLYLAFDSYD